MKVGPSRGRLLRGGREIAFSSPYTTALEQNNKRLVVALIHLPRHMREAIVNDLNESDLFHLRPETTVGQLVASSAASAAIDIVVFNLGLASIQDQAVRKDVDTIMRALPLTLVLLVSQADELRQTDEQGLDRYVGDVGTWQSVRILRALGLLHAGGPVVPADTAAQEPDARCSTPDDAPAPDDDQLELAGLTPRERQVFDLVRRGYPNKVIAYHLSVQESTVKVHVRQMMRKLQVNNRTQVAFLASCCVRSTR